MRHLIALIALAVGLPLTAAGQSPTTQPVKIPPELERVLKYVPDDTHLVVVVPSLDQLMSGLTQFSKAIGVDDPEIDILEEPLGEAAAAVNTAGPLVLAVSAEREDPLLIVSLTSTESWKATTQPTTLPDDVLVFELGDERYAAVSEHQVAIVARERAELQRALRSTGERGRRFLSQNREWLGRRQVVVQIDVPAWRAVLEQHLDMIELSTSVGMADVEASLQIWEWLFKQIKEAIFEVETYAASLRFDADGASFEQRAVVKPDGHIGRYLKAVRKPKRDLLRGLPSGGAMAFASEWEEPAGKHGFYEALVKVMMQMESVKEKLGAENVEAVTKTCTEMYRQLSGSSGVLTTAPGGRGMVFGGLYLTKEGPAVQRSMRTILELYPDMMSAWGPLPSATVRCEREKISGVDTDVYHFSFETEDVQLQPVLEAFYGQDSAMYMAPHPEGVFFALGPQEHARKAVSQALAGQTAPLSKDKRVAALMESLSPDPQICLLVDIPQVFELGVAMMQEVGAPIPALVVGGKGLPLAGCTFYLEAQAVRAEVFVPTEPIKALVEAFEGLAGGEDDAY